jgi:hypothetical protein
LECKKACLLYPKRTFGAGSRVVGKLVTTPFAVFAKVVDGKCTYLQFMEDTFATGASFRSGACVGTCPRLMLCTPQPHLCHVIDIYHGAR